MRNDFERILCFFSRKDSIFIKEAVRTKRNILFKRKWSGLLFHYADCLCRNRKIQLNMEEGRSSLDDFE